MVDVLEFTKTGCRTRRPFSYLQRRPQRSTALAAREVFQRAVALASELLDVTPQALEISDGVFHVGREPDRRVSLGDVARSAREAGVPLAATHVFAPKSATTYAGAAHAAVVRVDTDTGLVHVERYAVAHDSGTVINPTIVEGQLEGGVVLGLGQAIGEIIKYDEQGRLLTDSFRRYAIPRAHEVPATIAVLNCPQPSRNNAEGIKGVGENGTMGAIPTIIGAVEDALAPLGLTLNDMPLRTEQIAAACERLRTVATIGGGSYDSASRCDGDGERLGAPTAAGAATASRALPP